jgi:hypothetical protein
MEADRGREKGIGRMKSPFQNLERRSNRSNGTTVGTASAELLKNPA